MADSLNTNIPCFLFYHTIVMYFKTDYYCLTLPAICVVTLNFFGIAIALAMDLLFTHSYKPSKNTITSAFVKTI